MTPETATTSEPSKKKIRMTMNQIIQSKYDSIMNAINQRASYYRENPNRFAKEYLNLNLNRDQEINLVMMCKESHMTYIASRGAGKSFLVAVFCCVYGILYPGTAICICSNTMKQATGILEKINDELMPLSANLRMEIEYIKTSKNEAGCAFKNGSRIKIVPATENARFNRATVLVVDEYRLLDKDFIDMVLRNFLTAQRTPQFLNKPEYRDYPKEKNKEIYASSAWYENHWAYKQVKDYAYNMITGRTYFVCSLPYQLAIKEGRLDPEKVEDEMSESTFSEINFMMENEALFYGEAKGSLYKFDDIDKNRKLPYPVLPSWDRPLENKKLIIPPKVTGEIRILSADIALMASGKYDNDATAIFLNQMLPLANGKYVSNILYTTCMEGKLTNAQALLIRKLFEEFDCDYLVQDARGVGAGCLDAILEGILDPKTGVSYAPLSCCNNDEIAKRCPDPHARKAVWAINATADFNSHAAVTLRDAFTQGSIRLLVSEYSAEEELDSLKGYDNLTPQQRFSLMEPYVHTSLAINELINLQSEIRNNVVRVSEKAGMRKDRYSSLSYNIWVAKELERERSLQNKNTSFEDMVQFFRAPKKQNTRFTRR